jgi:hypothetical protein
MDHPISQTNPFTDHVHSLDYSGFAYAAPLKYAIAPSSKPDLIVTPYILTKPKDSTEPTTPLPEGEISIPANSEVTSFDAESVFQACSLALQNGLIIPAIGCTILWSGVKADSSKKDVTFEAEYKPDGVLDLLNLSVGGVKMKKIPFPDDFKGLKSLKPTVLQPNTGVLVQMGFDGFKHTLYFKK